MRKDNQHFVPQGYLRKFTIEGEKSLLWEYDKITGKISKDPKSVRQICTENQYYAQEDENGNIDKDKLEDAFSKYVEDPGIRAIDSIPRKANQSFYLSGENKGTLAFFIAMLATRGPGFRVGVEEFHKKIVEKVGAPIIHKSIAEGDCPEILKKEIEKNGVWNVLQVEIKNWISLKPMIELAKDGGNLFLTKQWTFLRPAKGHSFVTSDNPYSFISPKRLHGAYQAGPFNPFVTVIVPLRKDLVLKAEKPSKIIERHFSLKRASKQQTVEINTCTITAALRYVYAPIKDPDILKKVKELKHFSQKLTVT